MWPAVTCKSQAQHAGQLYAGQLFGCLVIVLPALKLQAGAVYPCRAVLLTGNVIASCIARAAMALG